MILKAKQQIKNHAKCMDEIKQRTLIFNHAMAPWLKDKTIAVANCELAALQLRKIFELIAFSSLCAHLDEYSKARKKFEKDWNLAQILKTISRKNPNCLPRPIKIEKSIDPTVNWHITHLESKNPSTSEIIKYHGELGILMHAPSPFKSQPDHFVWFEVFQSRMHRISEILNEHSIIVAPRKFGFLVQMNSFGKPVNCAVFEKKE